jgi:hypothetical protein
MRYMVVLLEDIPRPPRAAYLDERFRFFVVRLTPTRHLRSAPASLIAWSRPSTRGIDSDGVHTIPATPTAAFGSSSRAGIPPARFHNLRHGAGSFAHKEATQCIDDGYIR